MEKNNKNKIPFEISFENPLKALMMLADSQPNRLCLAEPRGNMVRKYSFGELGELIETIAQAVSKTTDDQLKPIAIVAHSSFRTIAANMGALLGGGKTILIPVNCSAEEKQQIIADNQVELLILDDLDSSRDLLDELPFLPQLRQLWVLEDDPSDYHAQVSTLGWHDMLHLATQGKRRMTLDQQLEMMDDGAKLCRFYSRDELGLFQHHDYSLGELAEEISTVQEEAKLHYPAFAQVKNFLSIIPFNRVMSHVQGIYLPLLTGRMLMAVDREEAWKGNALPYSADCLVASSTFLTNAAEKVQLSISEHGGISQFGLQKNIERLKNLAKRQKGSSYTGGSMINFIAGHTLHCMLSRKLKEAFGGDMKLCFSIDNQLRFNDRLFYHSIALSLLEADEAELLVSASHDMFGSISYDEIRGTQLSENEDLRDFKIVG